MAGAIGKSTEVLHAMQNLIKVPEISQAMLELSREMSKVMYSCGEVRVWLCECVCMCVGGTDRGDDG